MARAIWKGAISFGLVHIPVALSAATTADGVDFDWLDKRSMDPVGYKRINKKTGKEITKDNIVKGVQYEKGRYVVLSEEEIRAAHPKSTQTIDIFAFVASEEIPLQQFDTPYYLSPDRRGGKVYALLRETLVVTGKVALAKVILHTKQHLALVRALDDALVLITLRWPSEVRGIDGLELSEDVTKASVDKRELQMAKRLVEDMTGHWDADAYRDDFKNKIMALVDEKADKGEISTVETDTEEVASKGADIIDLTELLKRSLRGKTPAKPAAKKAPSRKAAPAKKETAKKPSRTARKKVS